MPTSRSAERRQPPDKTTILTLAPFAGIAPQHIVVPSSEAQLAAAWADLSAQRHVGFDTESKPTFVSGQQSRRPDVAQFATPSRAYVLQLRHAGCEELTRALLADTGITKVGFDLKQDQAQLRQHMGVQAQPLIDLDQVFHRQGYPRSVGIKTAVAIVFGQRFTKSKKITTTNWAATQLDARQLMYAANDAYVALRVLQALNLTEDKIVLAPPR